MAEQDIVKAYLEGRIGVWGVFRRLTKLGVTASAALAVALGMPAAAKGDTSVLEDVCTVACDVDRSTIERLIAQMALHFEHYAAGGDVNPLAVDFARLGANNVNLLNESQSTVALNAGGNLNVDLVQGRAEGSAVANVSGYVGDNIAVNLNANLDNLPLARSGRNVNLGNVGMTIQGTVGSVPLNVAGNVGNIGNVAVD